MPIRSCYSDLAAHALRVLAILCVLAPVARAAEVCTTPSFDASLPFLPIPDVAGTPAALTAGSFYLHDGEPDGCLCDLAVAVSEASPARNLLVLLRGENNGAFAMQPENPVIDIADNPIALAAGRFVERAPSARQALTVLTGKLGVPGAVALYVPDAAGSYRQLGAAMKVGKSPRGMVAGDFNNDGRLDLAVLSNDAAQQVTILFGDGAGGFAAESPAILSGVTNRRVWSLAAGKFQGNAGPDDIAIASEDDAGNLRITVARRQASGGFAIQAPIMLGRGGEAHVAAGKFANGASALHDLAVVFTDGAENGKALVLSGGAQPTPERPVGNRPKSVYAGDLNGDGRDEVILATFTATSMANPDGKIAVYTAGASGLIDFERALWKTPRKPILPRMLATGHFGRDPGTGARHLGLAAANAPDLNTISVYISNGTGTFAAPSGFSTLIRPDARLFVTGNFHSASGDDKLLDIAFVRPDEAAGEYVLGMLLNNGERTFHEATIPTVRVGRKPLLMVGGRFDADLMLDLAVVDANPGDSLRRPRIRILRGQGGGAFAPIPGLSDVLLEPGETPVDVATGQFKLVDLGRPSDLAIVSATATGGTLKLFLNDGNGRLLPGPVERLSFKPAQVVSSNKLKEGGIYDVIVRSAGWEGFVFFENSSDVQFLRQEHFGNPGGDAETSGQFILGDIDADDFDDVIFLDSDRTVDVFRNTGAGTFTFKNDDVLTSLQPAFAPEQAALFLMDLGGGAPGLVGLVKPVGFPAAIVTARGDGHGGFAAARMDLLQLSEPKGVGFAPLPPPRTFFDTRDFVGFDPHFEFSQALAGDFANALHGNGRLDFGFLTRVVEKGVDPGECPSDPQPTPRPHTQCEREEPDALCTFRCGSPHCRGGCIGRKCRGICIPPCTVTSFHPFCEIKSAGFFFTVFRNTCDG